MRADTHLWCRPKFDVIAVGPHADEIVERSGVVGHSGRTDHCSSLRAERQFCKLAGQLAMGKRLQILMMNTI